MKFMMFVCTDAEPDTATDEGETPIDEWAAKNDASGVRVDGNRLRPPQDATVVRKRGGKVLVTDGPFAETHEWIAGFDIDAFYTISCEVEVLHVISGAVTARFVDREIPLAEGDSLTFPEPRTAQLGSGC